MPVKILWFHLRNSTGVVDIEWEPKQAGVTAIGGKSGQGKTAALNNIAWLLGGDRFRPEKAQRDGAGYPDLDVTLSNGLRVTRKGKKSSLKVIDTNKKLGNQSMLHEFVGTFALDAPKFLRLNGKEKADALLNIVPEVRDELRRLDALHKELYDDREAHGRITTQKEKYAAELPLHKDTPAEETSASALIEEIRKVDAANAENAEQRRMLVLLTAAGKQLHDDNQAAAFVRAAEHSTARQAIVDAEKLLADAKESALALESQHLATIGNEQLEEQSMDCKRDAMIDRVDALTDQPTAVFQARLADCEETNARVRANLEKKSATIEAGQLRGEYAELTDKIENTRAARIALLDNADLPLPGLGVASGELTYDGLPWDNLATSDQMKVCAAIAAAEKPECGFILTDGLETMDVETFGEFCDDMEAKDLQVIGTRVSLGDECSLIVQEGKVQTEEAGE